MPSHGLHSRLRQCLDPDVYPRTLPVSPPRAALADNAFVAADPALLAEALCIEEARVVARDNTVVYDSRRLQLPARQARASYVKARVRVREYPDGTLPRPAADRRLHRAGAQIAAVPTMRINRLPGDRPPPNRSATSSRS